MFLIKGLLIEFFEWCLNKLKGYKYHYQCQDPACLLTAVSNDAETISKMTASHEEYHANKEK
jgi:hypothetical protein